MMPDDILLDIRGLRVSIHSDAEPLRILDDVDLQVPRGRIVGVAGESGSGKSTLIRAILGILPRQAKIEGGEIRFMGQDLLALSPSALRRHVLGRQIGFVPQDPYAALNPVFRIGAQMMEVLRHCGLPGEEPGRMTRDRRARYRAHLIGLLDAVSLPDPEEALERYPHQFSGGQRQRIMIATALAARPAVILADEPTTALDVTTQLQVLLLMKELAGRFDVSMLFVTHDFGVIAQLCDIVAVMYRGRIVESGRTRALLDQPRHDYTSRLIASHPDRADSLFTRAAEQPPNAEFVGGSTG